MFKKKKLKKKREKERRITQKKLLTQPSEAPENQCYPPPPVNMNTSNVILRLFKLCYSQQRYAKPPFVASFFRLQSKRCVSGPLSSRFHQCDADVPQSAQMILLL